MLPLHEIRDSVLVVVSIGIAWNPRIDSILARPGEGHSFWRKLRFEKALLLLDSHNEVRTSLSLRGCQDDHPRIIFKLRNPRSEIGSRVLEPDTIENFRFIRDERRTEFRYKLLSGIPLRAELRVLGNALAVES